MRKKFLYKLMFLTPVIAFLLASSSFILIDYPQTLADPQVTSAQIEKYLTQEIKDKLLKSIVNEQKLQSEKVSKHILNCAVQVKSINNKRMMMGSGVIIHETKEVDCFKTYILTNQHVVGNSSEVSVIKYSYLRDSTISSTTTFTGNVLDRNEVLDIALIELETSEKVGEMAPIATDPLVLNQSIFLCGCPLGDSPFITNGTIAHLNKNFTIVTAFAINGSSGGGAFDSKGNLIGIIRLVRAMQLTNSVTIPLTNITYVIPREVIINWLEEEHLTELFK